MYVHKIESINFSVKASAAEHIYIYILRQKLIGNQLFIFY